MSTPIRASNQDLRALAAIVSQDRPDLPDGEGLPPSLLTDLMGQIRCDAISLEHYDPRRQVYAWLQGIPVTDDPGPSEDWLRDASASGVTGGSGKTAEARNATDGTLLLLPISQLPAWYRSVSHPCLPRM